jgi:hypothetical protein
LVKAHTDDICLKECSFHVNKKGRDRVRKFKRKEVHAWVKGLIRLHPLQRKALLPLPFAPLDEIEYPRKVTYNPYHQDEFIALERTGAFSAHFGPIKFADMVILNKEGMYI